MKILNKLYNYFLHMKLTNNLQKLKFIKLVDKYFKTYYN